MSRLLGTVKSFSNYVKQSEAPVDEDGARPTPSLLSRKIEDLEEEVKRGPALSLSDLPPFIDAVKNLNGVGIDDRKLLLEKLLTLMSRLPDDDVFAQKLQLFVMDILYKDLPHPPSGYLAIPAGPAPSATTGRNKNVTYAFRSADGRDYNPLIPTLGMAGQPYARSVPSVNPMPKSFLPDAGLVFDMLLKRDKFVPHPGGLSSLFFAFADLVIHSCFNTRPTDYTINDSSSYLDLSPLYGSSQKQVDSIRVKDGFGKIYNDTFADARLLMMPPSVCSLLIIFGRNHNYVAQKIYEINENGTYRDPKTQSDAEKAAQDEEIFQRSRLVNSGYFMKVILGDYVGAILGLVRDGSAWRLDPLATMRELDHEFAPQGEGNVCSVEFNLMYRWHASTSQPDEHWTQAAFKRIFGDKDPGTITVEDFKNGAKGYLRPTGAPNTWSIFADATRDANGRYSDAVLAKYLQDATASPASAFKARGTPEVLRVIEMMGIEQARSWGTCSLNEFRKFMGLKPYSTFREWNPDPEIAKAAEVLYHDIENLELHVGLQAEEAKKPMPGAGLCPGYTISRAILADAVCLTRGDRFLTVDFTPFNLTSWGYQDCQPNKNDGSFGGFLTKLLFRHLPEYYPAGSAWAHFPFMVPETMKKDIAKGMVNDYTWTRPVPKRLTVVSQKPIVELVLDSRAHFEPAADLRVLQLTKSVRPARDAVASVLLKEDRVKKAADFFYATAKELIQERSLGHAKSRVRSIDVVRDVINLVPMQWIADQVAGISLKTPQNPRGVFTPWELYKKYSNVADFVYVNESPVNVFTLQQQGQKTAEEFADVVQENLKQTGSIFSVSPIYALTHFFTASNDTSRDFLSALLSAGRGQSPAELAAGVFAEVVATAALWSKAVASIVDGCITGDRRDRLAKLARENPPDADAQMLVIIREVILGRPPVTKVQRRVKSKPVHNDLNHLAVGDEVVATSLDAQGEPTDVASLVLQAGEHGLLAPQFLEKTACAVVKAVFALNGISRAQNANRGRLNPVVENVNGSLQYGYVNPAGTLTPFPVTMLLQYSA